MYLSIIERAQTRLEALYGPAELPRMSYELFYRLLVSVDMFCAVASRAALLQADAHTMHEFESGFDYLALPHFKPRAAASTVEKDEGGQRVNRYLGRSS